MLDIALAFKKPTCTLFQTIKISPCVEMTIDYVIPTNGRNLAGF